MITYYFSWTQQTKNGKPPIQIIPTRITQLEFSEACISFIAEWVKHFSSSTLLAQMCDYDFFDVIKYKFKQKTWICKVRLVNSMMLRECNICECHYCCQYSRWILLSTMCGTQHNESLLKQLFLNMLCWVIHSR